MTYIENIFLCMVSPLLVAALCMGRRQIRFFLFCIAGMGVCLLSAYINTFLAAVVITALCFRLRKRENQKKDGAGKPARHEQEEKCQ